MKLFFRKLQRFLGSLVGLIILCLIAFLIFVYAKPIIKHLVYAKAFYYVYKGDEAYKKEEHINAIDYYKKALKLYPEHVKARYNLGNIYVDYEDYKSAIESYKTALKYNPKYLNARISLGIILAEELLEFEEAIKQYKNVVDTKTKLVNIPMIYDNREQLKFAKSIALYNMGLAYRDKAGLYYSDSSGFSDNLEMAAKCYKNSMKYNKHSYDAQYNYALTKHLLGLKTEALEGYCKSILLSPLSYEAHYNLAVLLRQSRHYEEATEAFKNAGTLILETGDTLRAAYIYDLLNETNIMAVNYREFKAKKLKGKYDKKIKTYSEELVIDDKDSVLEQLERSIIAKIKTASFCKTYFNEN